MKLLIVESPSKCKTIEGYLKEAGDFKCIATCGHFRELKDLSMIDASYNPSFVLSKNISSLKSHIAIADEILLATDDDREGEAIAWHICDHFHLPLSTPRITFNEITKSAILRAIENPTTLNMNLVNAQKCRQIIDLLVGYKISPFLWKNVIDTTNSLSAGRCQTPALKIIYDHYRKEVSTEIFYNVKGVFAGYTFSIPHPFSEEEVEYFMSLLPSFPFIFTKNTPVKVTRRPPLPFTTSRLQQVGSSKLNISPKEVMKLCQSLYEKGLITYMRTDSSTYSSTFLSSMEKEIQKYNQTPQWDHLISNGTTPHEAIRPTEMISSVELGLQAKEKKIYDIIWRNTLESCLEEAVYSQFTCFIRAPLEKQFEYTVEMPVSLGWQVVVPPKENNSFYSFYATASGSPIIHKKIVAEFTIKENLHYSESTLVKRLEKERIGRPSTFSTLVDKIQEKGYVVKQDIKGTEYQGNEYVFEKQVNVKNSIKTLGNEKGKLVMTHTGIMVAEFLLGNFSDIFNYEYSREMEERLESVVEWQPLCQEVDEKIKGLLSSTKKTSIEIKLDDHNTFSIGRHGAVIVNTQKEKKEYLKIKKNIDLEKLKRGEYKVEEVIDSKGCKGKYKEQDIYLKKGIYGLYTTFQDKNISLKCFGNRPIENITLEEIIKVLDTSEPEKETFRKITDDISIRKGKYGDYIFYKSSKMKKPEFFSIKNYNHRGKSTEEMREWIENEYCI